MKVKAVLVVLLGVLALLAGARPLEALATTADDQYISVLTQRGVAVSEGSRGGVISLGQSTAQKITADLSDHGLAYTATKVWQIAQQDYGLSDVPTTKAQKFTVAVMFGSASAYAPDSLPVVSRWVDNHPPGPPCSNQDPALAPWGGTCAAEPFGPYLR